MIKKMKYGAVVLGILAMVGGLFFLMIPSSDAKRFWMADGYLSDGTSGQSRYLDAINSGNSNLAHGDYAIFLDGAVSEFSTFLYNSGATGGNATAFHPYTVVPYDDPSTGLWTEVYVTSVSGYVKSGSTLYFGTLGAGIWTNGTSEYLTDQNSISVDFGTIMGNMDQLP